MIKLQITPYNFNIFSIYFFHLPSSNLAVSFSIFPHFKTSQLMLQIGWQNYKSTTEVNIIS